MIAGCISHVPLYDYIITSVCNFSTIMYQLSTKKNNYLVFKIWNFLHTELSLHGYRPRRPRQMSGSEDVENVNISSEHSPGALPEPPFLPNCWPLRCSFISCSSTLQHFLTAANFVKPGTCQHIAPLLNDSHVEREKSLFAARSIDNTVPTTCAQLSVSFWSWQKKQNYAEKRIK